MFLQITELKSIREQKCRLARQEEELSVPTLTDLDVIERIYADFKTILSYKKGRIRAESVNQRKKFLFIVLCLYSPRTLAGDKLITGLQNKLAELFQVDSRSTISNQLSDILFYYNQYKDFRDDADELHEDTFTYENEEPEVKTVSGKDMLKKKLGG